MERLLSLDKEEAQKIAEKFGITDYNSPPANFKEVDEEWVAKHSTFRIYGFKYHWFQQVRYEERMPLLNIHCFGSHDGSGFAMHTDYWAGKIRYFSFAGCIHEMREPTREECNEHNSWPGNCYHVSICNKCGYWRAIDSSD